ncbi:hypothetical protein [Azospirillum canadense]|uniref:hypothetical protein n=1 Tax=Azospirillum canadense TaxID=403962 RepID=UPI0022279799|nr:hypothetical protein [Azospirillum canadense]MCW2239585.1 heptaprenylglyceryl phosphate synthase [Azospirillum canadense]
MASIDPYRNDADALEIGDLKVENGTDKVAIYGSVDLTRDRQGLAQAKALKAVLDKVVKVLEADKNLPERIEPPKAPDQVKNPFS